ncbi:MAG: peptide-methionine (S)-S-oxide reductase [Chloroflexi bacterium]|nr:peptide-methionine (S)-S-oxide reductase [Chloroflexota bacterium]|tara:strand:+ start:5612 stop:6166 length:555 start_codon:yes stop_codon:yes gene_type:complete
MKHYINNINLNPPYPEDNKKIIFGMGCFWGAERLFWQIEGVYVTVAGYSGGSKENPSYEEVCSGITNHAEVVLVVYDPKKVVLEDLLKVFWENHDPTQYMRQGNDIGSQYRSTIYIYDDEDYTLCNKSKFKYENILKNVGYGEIKTEIEFHKNFYIAEEYHQQYLAKIPNGYCNHGFCQAEYKK